MSRMCREKGAIKHDDRLDCLAQGVKYYTDALAISAYETVKERNREDWNDLQKMWAEDPEMAANAMVFGMSYEQRQQVRRHKGQNTVHNWV